MLTNPKVGDTVWWVTPDGHLSNAKIFECWGRAIMLERCAYICNVANLYLTRHEALAAHVATLLVARRDALKRYQEATKAWRDAAAEYEALMQKENTVC